MTDNRFTNIRKNSLEQLFLDGVFCFVTHAKVAFFITDPQIHRYTDRASRSFISLIFACPPLIYLRSPLTPSVRRPREECRSYIGDTAVIAGNPLESWSLALQWLLVPVPGACGACLPSLFPPLAIVLLEGQSRLQSTGFMLR